MTVSAVPIKVTHTGNNSTRDWTFTFTVSQASDMSVYLVDISAGTTTLVVANYDVDLINSWVTYPTVASGLPLLTSSYKVILIRELDLSQASVYTNQGAFPYTTIEGDQDIGVMIDQQLQEQLDRIDKKDLGTGELDQEDVASITFTDGTVLTTASAGISLSNFIATILPFAGSSAPTGFLICDGSALSRTTYAALFAIISTTYGVGDGATTFNIPDMRETYPVGIGTRGAGVTAHDIFTLGQFKDDQAQAHWHDGYVDIASSVLGTAGVQGSDNGVDSIASSGTVRTMVTDAINGTPRKGTTTRGKVIGINYIIKY